MSIRILIPRHAGGRRLEQPIRQLKCMHDLEFLNGTTRGRVNRASGRHIRRGTGWTQAPPSGVRLGMNVEDGPAVHQINKNVPAENPSFYMLFIFRASSADMELICHGR